MTKSFIATEYTTTYPEDPVVRRIRLTLRINFLSGKDDWRVGR